MGKRLAALLTIAVCATCRSAPARHIESAPSASIDPIVEFLMTSAASDFHKQQTTSPDRFRDVRIGHLLTPTGEKQ